MNWSQNVIYVDSAPINYTIGENQQVSVFFKSPKLSITHMW